MSAKREERKNLKIPCKCGGFFYSLHIRLRRDDLLFEVGSEDLDADMFSSGEEESCTYSGIQEDIFFLFCEFEYILKNIDRGRRLLQEELDRGVGHDGFSVLIGHEVFDILCDRRDTESVLSSALHESEEELRRVFILHDIPRFIHDEHSFFLTGTSDIPHIAKEDIHSDRAEDVIEISHREDDETIFQIHIRMLREDSSKYSRDVFIESLDESASSVHGLEDGEEIFHERDFFPFCRVIFHSDPLQ